MSKIFIVTGHGNYAEGIRSSIEMLLGVNKEVYFVDFDEDDTDISLKNKYLQIMDKNKDSNVLFICDILGGTPYKVAAGLTNENPNMEVVAGCNIGSMIEAFMNREDYTIGQLADFIVETSKRFTVRFAKVASDSNEIDKYTETDEGI